MKRLASVALLLFAVTLPGMQAAPNASEYSIQAIRYATLPGFPVAGLVMGAPKDEKLDIAMVIWLIRGGGRNILFDSGFHRQSWLKSFPMVDFIRPDEAVKPPAVQPR